MQFPLSLDHLDEMLNYIREKALEAKIAQGRLHKLELSCEEALVNVISYGHPTSQNALDLDCHFVPPHFTIYIRDWGPYFNPIEADIDIQTGKSVEDRKIGGLGIHLFRKLVDEASYVREGDSNLLSFTLRLEVE